MSPRAAVALLATLLGAAAPALAQRSPGPAGWLQADAFYHGVSDNFGDWKGVGLRLVAPAGGSAVWYLDAQAQEAFRDRGVYGAVGHRHQLGRWFTLVSAGGGTGDFVLPDLRADWTLGRTWGPTVGTMLTTTYVNAKQGYEDLAVGGSLVFYFPGAVLEAGGRANWSWPDAVRTGRAHGALTLGRERQRYVTLRGSAGQEGYQLAGTTAITRRFDSREAAIAWREWLGGGVGFLLEGVWYDNPFYTRTGVTVGVFRHW